MRFSTLFILCVTIVCGVSSQNLTAATKVAVASGVNTSIVSGDEVLEGSFEVWHPVIITFTGPQTGENSTPNPFTDYRLDVTFTGPSNQTFTVPGFYAADGNASETGTDLGNKWRVKFPPNEDGAWTYNASFVTGNNVAAQLSGGTSAGYFDGHTGSFTVKPSSKDPEGVDLRGKGKLTYSGGHYLTFEGTGKPFMKAGANSPEVFLEYKDFDNTNSTRTYSSHFGEWKTGDPTWKGGKGKGIIGAVNYLSSQGINTVYFLTHNHEGDGKQAWPWISTSEPYRYDCSKLDQWDIVFTHFDKMGMMLHFVTTETENEAFFENMESGKAGGFSNCRKIYYRELVARFGYHMAVTWNIGEENGWAAGGSQGTANTDQQRKDFADRFRALAYYRDHISVHNGPSSDDHIFKTLLGYPSLTGPSIQWNYGKNIHAKVLEWRNKSHHSGHHWVCSIDEPYIGPEKGDVSQWRKGIVWGSIMAGGAGAELYIGAGIDVKAENFHNYQEYYRYAGIAADFIQAYVPVNQMEPDDNFIKNGWCLKKDNTYLLYLNNGGIAQVNVADGSYDIHWFDPRNGGDLQTGSVKTIQGGTNVSIGNAPSNSSNDWVVLIRSQLITASKTAKHLTSKSTEPIVLQAISDFELESGIEGQAEAYVHKDKKALAINAAKFKDMYAAAHVTFAGPSEYYDITVVALLETDGESSYKLSVGGRTISKPKQNIETAEDYVPYKHTWKGVRVNKNNEIKVMFNTHTNGKIPEGDTTAWASGTIMNIKIWVKTMITGRDWMIGPG